MTMTLTDDISALQTDVNSLNTSLTANNAIWPGINAQITTFNNQIMAGTPIASNDVAAFVTSIGSIQNNDAAAMALLPTIQTHLQTAAADAAATGTQTQAYQTQISALQQQVASLQQQLAAKPALPVQQPQQQQTPIISSTGLLIASLLVLIGGGIWLYSNSQKKKAATAANGPAQRMAANVRPVIPRPRNRALPKPRAVRGLLPAPRRAK
jgi:hypothetical protein